MSALATTPPTFFVKAVKALRATSPVAIVQLKGQDVSALAKLYDGIDVQVCKGPPGRELTLVSTDGREMTIRFEGEFNESPGAKQFLRLMQLGNDLLYHCQRAALSAHRKQPRTLPAAAHSSATTPPTSTRSEPAPAGKS